MEKDPPSRSGARHELPLSGVRVLALEQYIAAPFATQILGRLGAEVVKVEPLRGDAGRNGLPSRKDFQGRPTGATFFRNNLGKKSIAIDLKSEKARRLLLSLAAQFDVLCENLGPGRSKEFGLDYGSLSRHIPQIIYLSISGFGSSGNSPYAKWPALAGVAEAMAGPYEFARLPHQPPIISPMGPIGDTATALFGVIGVISAIRHRDHTGLGQFVDVAMYDSMVALCDYIPNYWSMGLRKEREEELRHPGILSGFRASDGWFMIHLIRHHQFERLANIIGQKSWINDPDLATPYDWANRIDDRIRPEIERWSANLTKQDAAKQLAEGGVPAAPCNSATDVINDPHILERNMLVKVPLDDGNNEPVIIAGNPVKMSRVPDEIDTNFPHLGEHTDEILKRFLHIGDVELKELRAAGIIA